MFRSGLSRLFLLLAIIAFTAALLAVTFIVSEGESEAQVFGIPLVGIGTETPCFLTLGGVGVLVIGGGAGIVEIGVFGVGLLFATGQVAGGLIALGQAGIGGILFGGQAGIGLTGFGQGMFGSATWTQAGPSRGKPFLVKLNQELGEILSFR